MERDAEIKVVRKGRDGKRKRATTGQRRKERERRRFQKESGLLEQTSSRERDR